jgi:hypothetical protein
LSPQYARNEERVGQSEFDRRRIVTNNRIGGRSIFEASLLLLVSNRLSGKRRKLRDQAAALMPHIAFEFRIAGTICLYCFRAHARETQRHNACGTRDGVLEFPL